MRTRGTLAAALMAAFLLSCGDIETYDSGKEAFCGGMDVLADQIRAGERPDPEEVQARLMDLVREGQKSPDADFVDLLGDFAEGVIRKDTGPEAIETTDRVADACSDYAEIDADL